MKSTLMRRHGVGNENPNCVISIMLQRAARIIAGSEMHKWMLGTLGLATAGQVVYQIGQRSVPKDASPLMVLTIAYLAAAALCIVLAWPMGALNGGLNLRAALAWPTWVIAISIVAIEIGYLTAYRSGWTICIAFTVASTLTVFALAVVGRFALGESLSSRQVLGLAFSCVALLLLSSG